MAISRHFCPAPTLYDVGFNYFFHGKSAERAADLVFFQGHSAPGIYARSYLEGRFSEEQLDNFRREVDGKGLSSYPHPWVDARLLAVSDRIDGAWADPGDLPGPFDELPAQPRPA